MEFQKFFFKCIAIIVMYLDSNNASTHEDFLAWTLNDPFSSYNKIIFPRVAQTETVQVFVNYYLVAITDFNELAGQLETTGYMKAKWTTELLTWDSTKSNMTDLMVSQNYFWRPPIVQANSVNSLTELGDNSYKIRIDMDGNQEWQIGVVAKSACAVDVSYYPFDTQTCELSFTPWGFTDVQVTLNTTDSGMLLTHFMPNVEWTVDETTVKSQSSASASYLVYKIKLTRKPGYFLINMIVPIMILSLLNGLVFILPADSGERVGYAITAFLTFAVFLTMVSENLPKASEPMSLLCYFLTLMLIMSALSTVITIMTLRVYHQDDDSPVPPWLKQTVSLFTCRKCKRKWCKKTKEEDEEENPIPEDEMQSDDESSDEEGESKHIEIKDDPDVDIRDVNWKVVGNTLDMFFFLLFLFGTVVITGFFLIPLAISAGSETTTDE